MKRFCPKHAARRFPLAAAMAVALALPGGGFKTALAQTPGGPPVQALAQPDDRARQPQEPGSSTSRDLKSTDEKATTGSPVDRLFARLGKTTDEAEGEGIGRRIEEQWQRSGSPTADLLMRRAVVATLGGDHALGVELIDRVIAIRPQWAEAWNRRAALFALLGDDQRAVIDLGQALTLEPRHFQALAAMGLIFSKNEDNRNAVRAWRKSLELNPFQPELKQRVEQLAPDVDGRDL